MSKFEELFSSSIKLNFHLVEVAIDHSTLEPKPKTPITTVASDIALDIGLVLIPTYILQVLNHELF